MSTLQAISFQVGDWNRLLLILGRLHDPLNALREFVQNARDAVIAADLSGNDAIIRVHLEDRAAGEGVIRIADNGIGMPRSKLARLFREICSSEKMDKMDLEGRFGIGLLSYLAIAERCELISRSRSEGQTWRLVFPSKTELEKDSRLRGQPNGTLEAAPQRGVPGTDVVLRGIGREVARLLVPSAVASHLTRHYGSQVSRGFFRLEVVKSKRSVLPVSSVQYRGEPFRKRLRDGFGIVDFELYLNPRPSDRSVQLVVGPAVLGDVARAVPGDLMNRPPWNEGRLEGEIKCDYLEPTPTRQKVVLHSKKVGAFLRAVGSVESEVTKRLDVLSEEKQQEEQAKVIARIRQAFHDIAQQEHIEHQFRVAIADPTAPVGSGDLGQGRTPGGRQRAKNRRSGSPTLPIVDRSAAHSARQRLRKGLDINLTEHENPEVHSYTSDGVIHINKTNRRYRRAEPNAALWAVYVLTCIAKEIAVGETGSLSSPDTPEVIVSRLSDLQHVLKVSMPALRPGSEG